MPGPLAVPPAIGNNAVITVKVGGDRIGTSGVTALAGVVLQLFDGGSLGPTTPAVGTWTSCTSDADGDCSFVVPNTQFGGANENRQFWVVQQSAPTGWFTNPTLGVGSPPTSTNYRFRTGSQLRAGNTYRSSVQFMLDTGNNSDLASGGIWQNSRVNPTAPVQCGLDVALILDLSSSVGADLPNLKAAANTFTNSLVGTPSRMSVFTFATNAPAGLGNNSNLDTLQPVSTAAGATIVTNKINGLTLPGGQAGGTNWDRGLAQVAASPNSFDIAVFITDGNPTFYGSPAQGPGNRTRFREVENGIFSANAIKAQGTRMIAFGVGAGVSSAASGLNLRSTSGPTLNSDYFQTTDYAAAGDQLRALALGACQGSITVIKQVVPPGGTIAQAVPAGGWTFSAATTTAGVGIAPPSGATAGGTGALNFNLTFPGGTTTAPINVTETQQTGYTVVLNGGRNATCTRLDTGATAPGYVNGPSPEQFTVTGSSAYPVSCIVYNRAPNPQATLLVDKQWVGRVQRRVHDVRQRLATRRSSGHPHGRRQHAGVRVHDHGAHGRLVPLDRRDDPAAPTVLHGDIETSDVGQRGAHRRCPCRTTPRSSPVRTPTASRTPSPARRGSSSSRTSSTAQPRRPSGTSRRACPPARRREHSPARSAPPGSLRR